MLEITSMSIVGIVCSFIGLYSNKASLEVGFGGSWMCNLCFRKFAWSFVLIIASLMTARTNHQVHWTICTQIVVTTSGLRS